MGVTLNWITDSVSGQVPEADPDRPALAFEDDTPITYRQLRESEFAYGSALLKAGAEKGSRVAVLMRNCIEYPQIFFGISRAGCVSVRLNWRLTGPELRFLLQDSGASVLLLDEEFVRRIEAVRHELPVRTYVIRGGSVPDWAVSLEDFAASGESVAFPELDPGDPATIMYTSGTTGMPKGAVLTHRNLLALATIQCMMWQLDENTVAQTSGPMFHAAAMEILVLPAMLRHGMGVFLSSGGFSLDRMLEVGRTQSTTIAFVYSHLMYELMRRDDVEELVAPSLTQIITAGDTVMPWVYEEFERRLPHARMDQTFGLTEGGMVCTRLRHQDARGHESSVGRPTPLSEIVIRGLDGAPVPVGEVGEIYTRNPGVSSGYWNRTEATAETFSDGWCRTGDLGRFDAAGFLTLAGRSKDMVRSGSENIYPAEIEKLLASCDGVADTAVVGVPDEKFFEVGCAVLVAHEGFNIDLEGIRSFLGSNLAKFKIPKYFVVVDELPRTATGKVLKHVLRAEYAKLGTSPTAQ